MSNLEWQATEREIVAAKLGGSTFLVSIRAVVARSNAFLGRDERMS